MKALVYGGPGLEQWKEITEPEIIDERDAIVRADAGDVVAVVGSGPVGLAAIMGARLFLRRDNR